MELGSPLPSAAIPKLHRIALKGPVARGSCCIGSGLCVCRCNAMLCLGKPGAGARYLSPCPCRGVCSPSQPGYLLNACKQVVRGDVLCYLKSHVLRLGVTGRICLCRLDPLLGGVLPFSFVLFQWTRRRSFLPALRKSHFMHLNPMPPLSKSVQLGVSHNGKPCCITDRHLQVAGTRQSYLQSAGQGKTARSAPGSGRSFILFGSGPAKRDYMRTCQYKT